MSNWRTVSKKEDSGRPAFDKRIKKTARAGKIEAMERIPDQLKP
jgi:hypothetical protein